MWIVTEGAGTCMEPWTMARRLGLLDLDKNYEGHYVNFSFPLYKNLTC